MTPVLRVRTSWAPILAICIFEDNRVSEEKKPVSQVFQFAGQLKYVLEGSGGGFAEFEPAHNRTQINLMVTHM
jgi:hypothetical protein